MRLTLKLQIKATNFFFFFFCNLKIQLKLCNSFVDSFKKKGNLKKIVDSLSNLQTQLN